MCSTPKSNHSKIPGKRSTAPLVHAFSSSDMARFTRIANEAEERREKKRQEKRARQQLESLASLQEAEKNRLMEAKRIAEIKQHSLILYWLFYADLWDMFKSLSKT